MTPTPPKSSPSTAATDEATARVWLTSGGVAPVDVHRVPDLPVLWAAIPGGARVVAVQLEDLADDDWGTGPVHVLHDLLLRAAPATGATGGSLQAAARDPKLAYLLLSKCTDVANRQALTALRACAASSGSLRLGILDATGGPTPRVLPWAEPPFAWLQETRLSKWLGDWGTEEARLKLRLLGLADGLDSAVGLSWGYDGGAQWRLLLGGQEATPPSIGKGAFPATRKFAEANRGRAFNEDECRESLIQEALEALPGATVEHLLRSWRGPIERERRAWSPAGRGSEHAPYLPVFLGPRAPARPALPSADASSAGPPPPPYRAKLILGPVLVGPDEVGLVRVVEVDVAEPIRPVARGLRDLVLALAVASAAASVGAVLNPRGQPVVARLMFSGSVAGPSSDRLVDLASRLDVVAEPLSLVGLFGARLRLSDNRQRRRRVPAIERLFHMLATDGICAPLTPRGGMPMRTAIRGCLGLMSEAVVERWPVDSAKGTLLPAVDALGTTVPDPFWDWFRLLVPPVRVLARLENHVPTEFLGWYRAFHPGRRRWGIFIRMDLLAAICCRAWRSAGGPRAYHPAQYFAMYLAQVLLHEWHHFEEELAISELELDLQKGGLWQAGSDWYSKNWPAVVNERLAQASSFDRLRILVEELPPVSGSIGARDLDLDDAHSFFLGGVARDYPPPAAVTPMLKALVATNLRTPGEYRNFQGAVRLSGLPGAPPLAGAPAPPERLTPPEAGVGYWDGVEEWVKKALATTTWAVPAGRTFRALFEGASLKYSDGFQSCPVYLLSAPPPRGLGAAGATKELKRFAEVGASKGAR